MTTKMSLCQSDADARIAVDSYRNVGFKFIAAIGPQTSIEVFGATQNARWIILASERKISSARSSNLSEDLPEIFTNTA